MRRNHIRAQRVFICKSPRIRVSTSMTVKKHTSRNRFRAHRSPEFEDRFVVLAQNRLSSPVHQIQHKTDRFFFGSSFSYCWRLKYGRLLRCFVCFFSYFFAFVPGATAKFFFLDQIKLLLADNFFFVRISTKRR